MSARKATTDPELTRQLDAAEQSGAEVKAVVRIRRRRGKAPAPAEVEAQTKAAVRRAAEASGANPTDVHVMGSLSVAYVSGPEKFVRELVTQPEVTSAVANEADES